MEVFGALLGILRAIARYLGEGSGDVQSTGVSQRVRATGRDESESVPPPPEKRFKTTDLELPFPEGSFPKCSLPRKTL